MIVYPNAKINVGLNVVAKRADGFHNIETLFVPYYNLFDILEFTFAEKESITLYGLPCGNPEENLCLKAYRLMKELYDIPTLAIQLYKKIPSGAGLGGGSSDAAFTLTTINRLCNLHLSNEKMAEIAATLGSDCPFFIYNKPMLASGRGEILKEYPIALSNYKIELTTPPVAVSTKEAYAGIAPKRPEIALTDALQAPIENWKELIKNDFELSVFAKYPQIAALKEQYYKNGALYASMSGSGSTVYGIFANQICTASKSSGSIISSTGAKKAS